MSITGGCRCGAVRYEAKQAPDRVSLCACRDCQKSAGAPLVSWAVFPRDAVVVAKGAPKSFNSSGAAFRSFCDSCGTGLFYTNEAVLPGLIDVQTLTFDAPDAFAPTALVQAAEAPRWLAMLHGLPAYQRYPG